MKRSTLDCKKAQRKIDSIGIESVKITDRYVNIKLQDGSKLKVSTISDSLDPSPHRIYAIYTQE